MSLTPLKPGTCPNGNGFRWSIQMTVVVLSLIAISGCGQNPLLGGNPAAQQPAADRPGGLNPAAAANADEVPVAAQVAGAGQAGVEIVQPDTNRPAPKTSLVGGLTQMLNSTPLDDEQKDSLLDQMEQADNLLGQAKQQNRQALRELSRQQRLRGPSSPNIIMIVADDLCMSDLSCYGPSEIETPNIDRLAKAGTRFTQAYAASPLSQDARWSLVAGQRPDFAKVQFEGSAALQSADVTSAEIMWQAGYSAGVFGHWGVMGVAGPVEPAGHGYTQWLGTFGPADEPQSYPEFVSQAGTKLRLLKNADGKQGQFAQDFFVAEASDFLTRTIHQHPVFLQFFFSVPGTRRTVPKLEHYADKNWPDAVKIRAAAITRMDRDIGTLMQRLERLKQLSNTVFIITSDTAGDPAESMATAASGEVAMRGHHGDLYEGGLRVPLIISGTGMIPAGKSSAAITAAWDLAPTIYQLAHVAKIPPLKLGRSLLPQLKPNAPAPDRFLKWELQHGAAGLAVRWKDWKAVRPAGSSQLELYDLKSDPGESKDVASQHPETVAEIQAKLTPEASKVAGKPK
jgi:arylsulfatase A